jgi:hypothetical protein
LGSGQCLCLLCMIGPTLPGAPRSLGHCIMLGVLDRQGSGHAVEVLTYRPDETIRR